MLEEKKIKEVKVKEKHIALKCLATSQGQVKKGEEFTCTDEELEIFKNVKAV
jgi:hypothetical protein